MNFTTRGKRKRAAKILRGAVRKGAKQVDLAALLGAHPVTMSRWVTGERLPGAEATRLIIEKVRHGQFFGVGGNMPLFSTEALKDEDLGAILTYLGL